MTALHVKLRHPLRDFELSLDLEVPVGVTVLFGPSGAGKSRTLAFIAGLARPNAGRIALGDEVWFDGATKKECAIHDRRVAFVFQSLALFPHMTAAANVGYGIDGSTDERRERAL